jgi:hypothetical protein
MLKETCRKIEAQANRQGEEEVSDFGKMTFHAGRKVHKCIWCGETIPVGEKMAHFKGTFLGQFQNWRMHQECYDAVKDDDDILTEGFEEYEGKRGSAEIY